jgi:hypothetical protein
MAHDASLIKKSIRLLGLLAMVLFGSQALARSEVEIKAAYVYNFVKFVTWPATDSDTDFQLCIYGDNPFGTFTEKFNSLSVRGQNIIVTYPDISQISTCNVLLINHSEEKFIPEIISLAAKYPILTISEIENFTELGGCVGFIKLGNIVRFDINLEKARAVGLDISSKLLKLANEVKQ